MPFYILGGDHVFNAIDIMNIILRILNVESNLCLLNKPYLHFFKKYQNTMQYMCVDVYT